MQPFDFQWKVLCGMRHVKEYAEQAVQPFCAENGLTPVQLRVLIALAHTGPQTMSGLAKESCIAGTNLSALCKQMAQNGFLERRRDEMDERHVMVTLTPKGKQTAAALAEAINNGLFANAQLSPRDMDVILAGFDRLLSIIEEDKEKAS